MGGLEVEEKGTTKRRGCCWLCLWPCGKAQIAVWVVIVLVIIFAILMAFFFVVAKVAGETFIVVGPCRWRANLPTNYTSLSRCDTYVNKTFDEYFAPAYEEVTFPSREDEIELLGWYLRGNSTASPTVIVVHGFGACRNNFNVMFPATVLRHHGYNVLLFSLRNHYPSPNTTSYASWGVKEHLDVLGAFDFIKNVQDGGKNASQIGLYGTSMGGMTSAIAFGMQKDIPGIFLDSAVYSSRLAMESALELEGLPASISFLGMRFASQIGKVNLYSLTPEKNFVDLGGRKVFVAHSTDDNQATVKHGELYVEKATAEGAVVGSYYVSTLGGAQRGPNCREHVMLGAWNKTIFEDVIVDFWDDVFQL